jgi:hypothetical protein
MTPNTKIKSNIGVSSRRRHFLSKYYPSLAANDRRKSSKIDNDADESTIESSGSESL